MSAPLQYTVPPEDAGHRLRHILYSRLGLSWALIQRVRENDRVRLNGEPVYLTQLAQPGDIITVEIDFEEESSIAAERMELDIIHEDQDFLVLNKPAGVLMHPVGQERSGTLANGVVYYWQSQGARAKFRPIHRLDRNTSGLVLVGKNQFVHQSLYKQFNHHSVEREYLALVEGEIAREGGRIDAPIGRKPDSIMEREVSEDGQSAITSYRVLERLGKVTLVSLHLETGRTHQIRVHMSYLGHPLLGDTLYGGSDALISRQALHSHRFRFVNPRSGSPVEFRADLAPDLKQLIERLRANQV